MKHFVYSVDFDMYLVDAPLDDEDAWRLELRYTMDGDPYVADTVTHKEYPCQRCDPDDWEFGLDLDGKP